MALESMSRGMNKVSTNRMRRRTRTRTAPHVVFATIAIVAISQILVSSALLSERFNKHPSSFAYEKSCSSSIGDSIVSGNTFVSSSVRSNTALHSSLKSTNKKNKKRKRKDSSNTKGSGPSSSSSESGEKPLGRSISKDELCTHLNSKVNYGKRGPAGPRARSRGIIETDDDESADYVSDRQKDQQFFLRQLNNRPTLVLNANYLPLGYMPLSLWSWQDAVKAIFKGSVTVVDVYPDVTVRASNIKVPLPSVIALNDYVPQKQTKPSFTRRNVFLRDEYICQYCNKRFHTADLSLDHVVPRSMGGPLSWENIVTCCKKCNGKKGSTPLSEIGDKGMKLNRTPRCPSQRELAAISGRMVPKRVHPTWKPYLGIQQRPPKTDAKGKKGDEEFIDDRYFEEEAE